MRSIAIVLFCLALIGYPLGVWGQDPGTRPNLRTEIVNWCDLARKPARYAGKVVRLRAILVENHTPRIDGADPFLYGPDCRENSFTTTVRWLTPSYNASTAHEDLDKARQARDEFGVSRVSVVLVGTFSGAQRRTFGHLGWADSQFVIRDVEEAKRVHSDVAWPKWVEKVYKKARHNKSLDRSGGSVLCNLNGPAKIEW
jgi:hypothetical protein